MSKQLNENCSYKMQMMMRTSMLMLLLLLKKTYIPQKFIMTFFLFSGEYVVSIPKNLLLFKVCTSIFSRDYITHFFCSWYLYSSNCSNLVPLTFGNVFVCSQKCVFMLILCNFSILFANSFLCNIPILSLFLWKRNF